MSSSMNPNDVLPEIVWLVYAGEIDDAMDLYAEDCVMIEKPNVVLRGKNQIRQSLQTMVSSGNVLSVQMQDAVISGDIAYSVSQWTITKNGVTTATGKATDLLRRTQTGEWRMLLDNPFGASALTSTESTF
jgi:ketosteroid isomerase-like protein